MSFYTIQRLSDIQNESDRMLSPIDAYLKCSILTLDFSVKPLESLIPDITHNARIAKERTKQYPVDGLTQDESAAIYLYTMEWKPSKQSLYFYLNNALRAQNRRLLTPYAAYLKLILSGLQKLPSIAENVWSGVEADLSSRYRVGSTIVWWGLNTCVKSPQMLESAEFLSGNGTRTIFTIECRSGKQIRQHSYFPEEDEVLIMPGTLFEVRAETNAAPDLHVIHLKQVESKCPFAPPHPSHMRKPYHNSELENLIHHKASVQFAEFRDKSLNNEDVDIIASELVKNTYWQDLSLCENSIGSVGAASLSKALLTNSTLKQLRLVNNGLGDEGVEYIALALHVNTTLECLYMQGNKISSTGTMKLSVMLKINKSLTYIHLSDNNIGDDGMAALVKGLRLNKTLKHLDLTKNNITNRSAEVIEEIFSQNQTLLFLKLSENLFSNEIIFTLSQTAEQSNTCVYFT
ncbi:unnamed protein product [Adineta ricciae]|uniref:NAD(P)(+)--arginine ADP-ribosyltransferase n=1 Tax=Adineta ricciae TaxID=249248 RepID=A0A814FKI4_ADIRI|nr:unnamed protein product [Adineta ricciae]CAF1480991.1 unnamed protein product [Adineta ricciae]